MFFWMVPFYFIATFCGLDEAGTVPGKGGIPAVRKVADQRFEAIQTLREDLADTLERLQP